MCRWRTLNLGADTLVTERLCCLGENRITDRRELLAGLFQKFADS